MSVSFIYQNMTFYYRIDSHSSSMPFIAWGCRQLPISGTNIASKEQMMEDIKAKLKQYYRNRPVRACDNELLMSEASNGVKSEAKPCDNCGLTPPKMEAQSTCPQCLIDNE
jgi:hypothetical protein